MNCCRRSPFASDLFKLLPAVLALFALGAFPFAARAQSASATLSGTILDPNGAVVPGASVTITEVNTLLTRTVGSNDQGYFTIPLLKPSTYNLRVEHQGFLTAEVRDILLNVGDERTLRILMKVGDVRETVNVTGEAPLINESPAVGTVVNRQFVENIPLNGRSFQSLITLTPGIVTVPSINSNGQFSVNGQRPSSNYFMVDGVSADFGANPLAFGQTSAGGNTPGLTTFGTTQSLVSVDALQEFKVQTSTYAAEYGRQPGGQISMLTRSGGNQFHGSAFDYVRNDVFDANDWFANANRAAKAPERQNDFGGTFSGPLMLPAFGEGGPRFYNGRNRTFFFFSYEGLRLRLPRFSLVNVPTLCLRGRVACPAGQSVAPAGMQPILNGFPLPNGKEIGNGFAEFSSTYSDPSTLDAASIRIDHAIGKKLFLFGRYNRAPSETSARLIDANLSRVSTSRLRSQTFTVGTTWSLNTDLINEARVNISDAGASAELAMDNFGGAVPPPLSVLVPNQYAGDPSATGAMTFNIAGRTSAALPSISVNPSRVFNQKQVNLIDTLAYRVGSHQFKLGLDYRRLTPTVQAAAYLLTSTFTSLQQVLNATAATGAVAASVAMYPVFSNFSAFGQDDWKVTRRLTFDYGIRWDVNPAPNEKRGNLPVAVDQITNLATMQLAPLGTKEWKTEYKNFAPRLGFAYQLFQKPGRETILRGGFGAFYDTGNDLALDNFNNRFPYSSTRSVTNVVYPLSTTQVAPAPFAIQSGITPPYATFFAFDPNLKLPYTLQWNFAVERALGSAQSLTVSYVGAAGRRLMQSRSLTLTTINPKFTTITLTTNNATSDYDALQTQFQRRLSRGLQVLASYTWSHALDDDSSGSSARAPKHGNASFDVRHLFAMATTYNIPAPYSNKALRGAFGGWSLDGTVHAQSAPPVDIVATTLNDPADGSTVNVRPNVIPGVPLYLYGSQYPDGKTINNTVPTAAQIAAAGCLSAGAAKGPFCTPPTGQSGNLGRNEVRAFPAWQVDLALRRELPVFERLRVQLRAESFNMFNHANFGAIQTTLGAANFGQATNMLNQRLGGISPLYQIGGPRSFQFALKVLF